MGSMPLYMTSADVAEKLGITKQAVSLRAIRRGVGTMVGNQRLFTDTDYALMLTNMNSAEFQLLKALEEANR